MSANENNLVHLPKEILLESLPEELQHRSPVRMSYSKNQCLTFYCPKERDPITGKIFINESVGIPIANGSIENFERVILDFIARKETLSGVVYVAGVDMRSERTVYLEHLALLEKYELQNQLDLKIISIPKQQIKNWSIESIKALLDRARYWFPSIKRDYETPIKDEVLVGLAGTAVIELGTIYYLFNALPTTDAMLTISIHTAILVTYAVYTKTILNWLLRPGSNSVEGFLKQMSMSLPFVLNYNIFGQYTPIVEFLKSHSVAETMEAFPMEVIEFASSQSVTLFLHGLFYYSVMTQVIGKWSNSQKGLERNSEARVFRKVAEVPALAASTLVLSIASGAGAYELLQLGPIEINNGHALMLGLTAFGLAAYKVGLSPSFDIYLWSKKRASSLVSDFIKNQFGIDIEYASKLVRSRCENILGIIKGK